MITFEKFFALIEQRGLSQNELMRMEIVDSRLLFALRNNKSITTNSLNKLCNNLRCDLSDIATFTMDEEDTNMEENKENSKKEKNYEELNETVRMILSSKYSEREKHDRIKTYLNGWTTTEQERELVEAANREKRPFV